MPYKLKAAQETARLWILDNCGQLREKQDELLELIGTLDAMTRRDVGLALQRRLPQTRHYHMPGGVDLLTGDRVRKLIEEETSVMHRSERGQTLVEYGLLIALIAVVVIVALLFLGPIVSGLFDNIGQTIDGAPNP